MYLQGFFKRVYWGNRNLIASRLRQIYELFEKLNDKNVFLDAEVKDLEKR